jgi:predicted permease
MPDFREYVRRSLPPLGVSGPREQEVIEELALDLQERYERALVRGLTPEEAWQETQSHARSWPELARELGSALAIAHVPPEPAAPPNAALRLFGEFRRDLVYAARQLSKSPGFTIVAVLMLALGIGANTAIFSLLNAVLFRHLPVREPEQLVFFGKTEPEGHTGFLPHGNTQVFSYPFFREFRRANQVFAEVAAIQSFLTPAHGRVGSGADLEKINVELVSGTYFATLGVPALQGRMLTDADDRTPGGHPVAVASYSWWQKRFSVDSSLAGRTVTIGPAVYTIVGIAAPGFSGVTVGQSPDLWIPLAMEREIQPDRNGLSDNMFQSLHMLGRLKPGLSITQAQANTNLVFHQILRNFLGPQPPAQELSGIGRAFIELTSAATGRSNVRRHFSSPLKILMAVVALVLLIACANVANLLLARAASRQREIAVRMSLGARRSRLIRQLLAESGLLGFLGAALGIALAWSASRLLLAMVSVGSELVPIRVTPDAGVLGFSVAVTLLTVLLFGAAPAFRATALELALSLKAGRGIVSSAARNRLAQGLVVGQVALSLVLLAGAGLFLRSLANLRNVDVGFDRHNVLRMRIDPSAAGYRTDPRLNSMMRLVEERVNSLPGITAASFALSVFDGGGSSTTDVTVPGRPESEKNNRVNINLVGPGYFDVMKIPLIVGRTFNARDNDASRKVAVINQTMAQTFFPGGSPLGRTFSVGDEADTQNVEVVGVVKDAKYMELEEEQMSAAFFPHAQHHLHYLESFVVRYTGDTTLQAPAIRKAIGEIDPNLPVSDTRSLANMVDDFTLNRRLVAQLSTLFGVLAALLACIGIYGVMSYAIARRTGEFGIRMALGARRRNVLWVVLRETVWVTVIGIAIGLTLALAGFLLIESLLFGVQPANVPILGISAAALTLVALLAGYLPARRATLIDPSIALRHD